jgi:hypothetical protein
MSENSDTLVWEGQFPQEIVWRGKKLFSFGVEHRKLCQPGRYKIKSKFKHDLTIRDHNHEKPCYSSRVDIVRLNLVRAFLFPL